MTNFIRDGRLNVFFNKLTLVSKNQKDPSYIDNSPDNVFDGPTGTVLIKNGADILYKYPTDTKFTNISTLVSYKINKIEYSLNQGINYKATWIKNSSLTAKTWKFLGFVCPDLGSCCNQTPNIYIPPTYPTFYCPDTITLECGSAIPDPYVDVYAFISAGGVAIDNCKSDLIFSHVSDVTTGTCVQITERTYSVADGCGNYAECTQLIIIQDIIAPIITGTIAPSAIEGCDVNDAPPAVTTVAELELMGLTITDNCTETVDLVVTYEDVPVGTCPIVITRTYTVTDECNNKSTIDQLIIIQDTTVPSITGTITPSTIEGCSSAYAPTAANTVSELELLGLTISDNCTSDIDLVVTHNDVPNGSILPIIITRTYTVTDECNNQNTIVHTITVDDTTAPSITGTISGTTIEGCSIGSAPSAKTTVAGLESLGLSISDNCTSDINLVVTHNDVPTGTCPIVITRTYTVTDGRGNFNTVNHIITIQDTTVPIISGSITPTTIEGCSTGAAPVAATTIADLELMGLTISDNCTSDINLVVTHNDVPVGTCPIVITRTYTITDECGNHNAVNHVITIQDTTVPSITGTIEPTSVEGTDSGSAPAAATTVAELEALGVSVSDACTLDVDLVVTHNDVADGVVLPITITRTYTVTDECGNHNSVVHTITIVEAIIWYYAKFNTPWSCSLQPICSGEDPEPCEPCFSGEGTIPPCPSGSVTLEASIDISAVINPYNVGPAKMEIVGSILTVIPCAGGTYYATIRFTDEFRSIIDSDLCTQLSATVPSHDIGSGCCDVTLTESTPLTYDDVNSNINWAQSQLHGSGTELDPWTISGVGIENPI
jgi:hypothetical protein